jgi:anti-sigma28 factor (negative regulator of flagellin synthesis)
MDIKRVAEATMQPITSSTKKESGTAPKKPSSGDSVTLSPTARSLYEANEAKKLELISERLQSGFYSQQGVIEKVAERIISGFSVQS